MQIVIKVLINVHLLVNELCEILSVFVLFNKKEQPRVFLLVFMSWHNSEYFN